MGASHSKSDTTDEKIFQTETPISFSPDVVNQLANRLDTPETTPERQAILDAHIRARIRDELEHLKRDEQSVREEIEQALEKENLDRETSMAGEALAETESSTTGNVKNSAALFGDLEEVRAKIERQQSNKRLAEVPEVEIKGSAVAECYRQVHLVPPIPWSYFMQNVALRRKNSSQPLLCQSEVNSFKAAVNRLEQQYFQSLQ